MSALIDVIFPVFVIIGVGYLAALRGMFPETAVDGLMRFAQTFAVPCLLFRGVARLDLSAAYNPGLMLSFYTGAYASFALCLIGALVVFKRPLTDAVAIGFAGLFSNSLLLGMPITERAYGTEALTGNYAIISIHSPLLYATGITLMEWARSRGIGLSPVALTRKVLRAIFTQPMVLGILCGFAVNLTGLEPPGFIWSATELMARAAIPAALFGLGGVLFRYRPEGDKATIAMICFASLIVHPGIAYVLAHWVFGIDTAGQRSAVVTAAMAPGVNAYLFAHVYGVAKRVNASAVLIATALSMGTVWVWLHILP